MVPFPALSKKLIAMGVEEQRQAAAGGKHASEGATSPCVLVETERVRGLRHLAFHKALTLHFSGLYHHYVPYICIFLFFRAWC